MTNFPMHQRKTLLVHDRYVDYYFGSISNFYTNWIILTVAQRAVSCCSRNQRLMETVLICKVGPPKLRRPGSSIASKQSYNRSQSSDHNHRHTIPKLCWVLITEQCWPRLYSLKAPAALPRFCSIPHQLLFSLEGYIHSNTQNACGSCDAFV